MKVLTFVDHLISVIFLVCYAYQSMYLLVPFLLRKKKRQLQELKEKPVILKDYAVLICARNEASVIGELMDSLHEQSYPKERLHIFVLADNCTDLTAEIARKKGAIVYERENRTQVGKGYAMEALLNHIREDYPDGFDGYFVFDADNLLAPDYIDQMNRSFALGYEVVTSYRNSKNYCDNWISAGYSLAFIRSSKYLNEARYLLGNSCTVTGTGFLFSRKVADEMAAWPFHLLTEDIEFSVSRVLKGEKIGYCPEAMLYDEQPVKFSQSWHQRKRWLKGHLQVLKKYGGRMLGGIFSGNFSCYDLTMSILPVYVMSAVSLVIDLILNYIGLAEGTDMSGAFLATGELFFRMYMSMYLLGLFTTVTQWKKIQAPAYKKILYTFTYPLFNFTYIPISIVTLFSRVEWVPIEHLAKNRSKGKQIA